MTNPDNVGGLPPLPKTWYVMKDEETPAYDAEHMRAYGELCRAAPAGGDVECFVREMRTSKGPEFFVVVRCNGRELTPHMYTERWKAEYDVASWQHLLCGAPEPDLLAYGPSEDSAPAGSGEELAKWVEGARDYVTGGNVRPDDGDEDQEQWDRLTEAAALLRKLQQPAEEDAYVIEKMGRLLAEIAVIVNGPEPARTRWSYHDLPEKVRALQEQRVASPEIPFLATPMTDHSEGSRLRWEYEKGWNDCRETALRALSRGVPEGMVLAPVEPTPEMIASCPGGLLAPACVAVYKTMISAAIAAQRKEG